jgi:N-acetylglucosamine-6-sulfatase
MMETTLLLQPIILLWLAYCATSGADDVQRPNILLLLTDDQDVMLGSFDHMPKVQKLLQEQGMTFTNAFVHTPICCPSRSSILTGRYLHNAGVRNNSISGNCYGQDWKERMENEHTYAVDAKRAGYTTAYTGKYLNEYGFNHSVDIPEGWDHWLGLIGNSHYYNCSLIEGGIGKPTKVVTYGDVYPDDYLPNIMQHQVLEWFSTLSEPWLIVMAWPTPHGPFTPAPWAAGTMSDYHPPITENYNASSLYMQQKHWLLRQLLPLTEDTADQVDKYYQMRLEALKSVDKHVGTMMQHLEQSGQVENSVIMYTSDNGFQFGQHRLSIDKRHLYENDIRVPFCIRGPGIPPNSTSDRIVANIDIAPSILDMVMVQQKSSTSSASVIKDSITTMDGSSFWKYVRGQPDTGAFAKRHDLLITYHGEGQEPCGMANCPPPLDGIWWMPDSFNNTYHCVRTLRTEEDSIYCRFEDDERYVEFYNLTKNPHQLDNDYADLETWQIQRYEHRLQELMNCQGATCRDL